MNLGIEVVAFDIGNVIVPWNPMAPINAVEPNEHRARYLAEEIITTAINHRLDSGESFESVRRSILARHPCESESIDAWWAAWETSITPPDPETLAVVEKVGQAGYRTVALTNFAAETWQRAMKLAWFRSAMSNFENVVISGFEGLAKPDPALFTLALKRWNAVPESVLLVDDNEDNIAAAESLGMQARWLSPHASLAETLTSAGLDLR
jgi:2-haloacid dehalogenase